MAKIHYTDERLQLTIDALGKISLAKLRLITSKLTGVGDRALVYFDRREWKKIFIKFDGYEGKFVYSFLIVTKEEQIKSYSFTMVKKSPVFLNQIVQLSARIFHANVNDSVFMDRLKESVKNLEKEGDKETVQDLANGSLVVELVNPTTVSPEYRFIYRKNCVLNTYMSLPSEVFVIEE